MAEYTSPESMADAWSRVFSSLPPDQLTSVLHGLIEAIGLQSDWGNLPLRSMDLEELGKGYELMREALVRALVSAGHRREAVDPECWGGAEEARGDIASHDVSIGVDVDDDAARR
jgi:hypothetical protein